MKKVLLLLAIFVAAYANAQTYKVGDMVEFPDKSFGVIFYLDERTGDVLAASMDEIETQWEAADEEDDCHNIFKLQDKGSYGEFCIPGVGLDQTNFILEQLGPAYAPAAAWCSMHGEGW